MADVTRHLEIDLQIELLFRTLLRISIPFPSIILRLFSKLEFATDINYLYFLSTFSRVISNLYLYCVKLLEFIDSEINFFFFFLRFKRNLSVLNNLLQKLLCLEAFNLACSAPTSSKDAIPKRITKLFRAAKAQRKSGTHPRRKKMKIFEILQP